MRCLGVRVYDHDGWLEVQQERWQTEQAFIARIFRSPWTRSNGSVVSRVYERLTKASRRRVEYRLRDHFFPLDAMKQESAYRQGVYDAFKALQEELQ